MHDERPHQVDTDRYYIEETVYCFGSIRMPRRGSFMWIRNIEVRERSMTRKSSLHVTRTDHGPDEGLTWREAHLLMRAIRKKKQEHDPYHG